MTTFPRAGPSSRYRIASGTSLSGYVLSMKEAEDQDQSQQQPEPLRPVGDARQSSAIAPGRSCLRVAIRYAFAATNTTCTTVTATPCVSDCTRDVEPDDVGHAHDRVGQEAHPMAGRPLALLRKIPKAIDQSLSQVRILDPSLPAGPLCLAELLLLAATGGAMALEMALAAVGPAGFKRTDVSVTGSCRSPASARTRRRGRGRPSSLRASRRSRC